ncbi:MAG: methionine--tRNA ligase [Planctomycetaceae bacterium]|nr:methionine--tRNA ligase [Planctomycetaceae bacterium]
MRQILVTSALPYANGHIHIGHLVEYMQTDIWVRFQKLRGRRCVYLCADDTHGTAIMIRARQEGIREEQLIAEMREAHMADFAGFQIAFDNYGSTNSPETRAMCEEIWASLRRAELVVEQEVVQLYDTAAGTFLADRFVKGSCPKCQSPNQYGDSCDRCGAHYSPADLIDPVSTLSGSKPELRKADHLFVHIEKLHDFLEDWTQHGEHLQPEVANYLAGHFLCEPLHDWDVSRPAPYFGFEIPDSPGNYWYVWFDAPIGYMGSTRQWCDRHGESFDDWWRSDQTEIHHFIGKDITYFHTLFWPAMLQTAGFRLPTKVHIHGFLTVNGEKMSKSKGTFIRASTYLEHLDPAYLRYYYASKLTARVDDIDLNFDELIAKVNADMVGNVVNLASRVAKFAEPTGLSSAYPDDDGLFAQAAADGQAIAEAYESGDYAKAIRWILAAGDRANQFIEHNAPWTLRKDPSQCERLRDVCTIGLNLFRQLVIYLSPVLPRLAEQAGELLHDPIACWDQSQRPLLGTPVGKFSHLMQRVDPQRIEAVVAASAQPAESPAAETLPMDSDAPLQAEPLSETIHFEQFAKVDLRVARVLQAEDVPGAQKLLRLTLSLGGDNHRNVFAGIKGVYQPENLIGRLVICAANLAPRKMKFGTSEGMIVAAGGGGGEIYLLSPDSGAKPGQRVH